MTDAFPNNWRPRIVQTVATGSAYPETAETLVSGSDHWEARAKALEAANAALKAERKRHFEESIFRDTALSAALEIIEAPEIAAVLSRGQQLAYERIVAGLAQQGVRPMTNPINPFLGSER